MRAPRIPPSLGSLLDPAVIDDPHALYAGLRAEMPLSRIDETGVHVVANWALIDEALSREADFSANLTGVLVTGDGGAPSVFPLPLDGPSQVIATADEPDHGTHRRLVQPGLTARRIASLEAGFQRRVRTALEPLVAGGGGDFVPIAETVPAQALARVLGLPEADVGHFRRWSMMGGDMLAGTVDPEQMAALGRETGRMAEYLSRHLEAAALQHHAGGEAPLLEVLAGGVREEKIAPAQALGIAIILFGAGGESTAALLGSAVRLLAEDPALADRLRQEPRLIPRFVEEVVRLEPPFKFHYRAVRRRCTLGGFDLDAGDHLMLTWAAANRDPATFDEPDELRLDRRHPNQHMGFGRGGHFCVGASLARLEARVVVEQLLAATTRLALSPGAPPRYARSIFVRRHEHLPVEVG